MTDLVLKYEWKVEIFQTIPDCYLINVRFCWLFSVCLPFQLITTLISFPVSGLLSGKNIHLASVFFLQYRGRLHRVSWFLKDRDLKVSNNRIFLSLFVWRRLTDCPNYQYMSNINCYFIDLVNFFFSEIELLSQSILPILSSILYWPGCGWLVCVMIFVMIWFIVGTLNISHCYTYTPTTGEQKQHLQRERAPGLFSISAGMKIISCAKVHFKFSFSFFFDGFPKWTYKQL